MCSREGKLWGLCRRLALPALAWIVLAMQSVVAGELLERMKLLPESSLVVIDPDGRIVYEQAGQKPLIPASIFKVLTAYYAVQRWGLDHRFYTDFYLDAQSNLYVKAWGDPWLDSHELDAIARQLRARGLTRIKDIRIDVSAFGEDLASWKDSQSDNPYDALPGAFSANFNSIYAQRKKGRLSSLDPHTPLTATAIRSAQRFKGDFAARFCLGADPHLAEVYAGELLNHFLKRNGVATNGVLRRGILPRGVRALYRHYSSRNLEEVLRSMLKHSNNFIANQLFLRLGAETAGYPATMAKAAQTMFEAARRDFGWNNFWVADGAGLSRKNRINARQMAQLLSRFEPYRELLPSRQGNYMYAKTGTLNGVSTLVGYVPKDEGWYLFALLINHPVSGAFRYQLIKEIIGQ